MEKKLYEEVSLPEIVKNYPYLEEYLATNNCAFIYEDRRLLSAEERIQMFGGGKFVLENLNQIKGKSKRVEAMILQAARPDVMAPTQMTEYGNYLHITDSIGLIYATVMKLRDQGDLKEVEKPVIGFNRHDDIFHMFERPGYRTSPQGSRVFSDLFQAVQGNLINRGGLEPV